MGVELYSEAKFISRVEVRLLNADAPRLPTLYAVALPWGAIDAAFQRMSPPDADVAPVSRLSAVFTVRVVVPIRFAIAPKGKAIARKAIAVIFNELRIMRLLRN
jgi:hypothetical protein